MFSGRIRRASHSGSGRVAAISRVAPQLPFVLPLVLAVGVLSACGAKQAPDVGLGQVSKATVTEVVEAPATIAARASAGVVAPAAGSVAELKVKDGQRVAKGQVLLVIDSPAARKQLDAARAADAQLAGAGSASMPRLDLSGLKQSDVAATNAFRDARTAASAISDPDLRAKALAQLASAEADYRAAQSQARHLADQVNSGLASLGQLTASLSQAQRAQTRAAVTAAQSSVDALTVRSPIAGTVVLGGGTSAAGSSAGAGDLGSVIGQLSGGAGGAGGGSLAALAGGGATGSGAASGSAVTATVEAGTPVSAGAPLLTVTDVSTLGLAASVDETDVLLVTPGIAADVELDAVPGAVYAATVRSVDLQPTASARGGVSYAVRLTLGAGRTEAGAVAPAPRPGMSAVARLKVRTATDTVSLPAAAVFRDGNRDAVWLVSADGTAHRRQVQLGAQGDAVVQVTGGVDLGQQVVVRGADRVTEGQQVAGR
jgi:HlyD family secretion protein